MKELQHEYFPHDYTADGDEKSEALLKKLGNTGYGIFWRIVERLYRAGGLLASNWEALSWSLRDDPKKIKSVVEDFKLFYRKGKNFGSHSVDRRLDHRRDKSEKAKQAAYLSHASVKRLHSDRSAKKKEEKGKKERKEIKIPASRPPTIEEVRAYCMERRNRVDPDRWLSHYQANGWKVGQNRMKDWRAAVRTWEHDGSEPRQEDKVVKTCESEQCYIFTGGVRPINMKFPKDCEKCEKSVHGSRS